MSTESPIDAMSLVVLKPDVRTYHVLALGGLILTGVHRFLDEHRIKTVTLALDSDEPGAEASRGLSAELSEKGYGVQVYSPLPAKDWNECWPDDLGQS